jgi:hypothetical protein
MMSDHPDPVSAHLDSLYRNTLNGDIFAINQWDGGLVPRFHLCRSAAGNQWRFRDDLAPDLVSALEALCRKEDVVTDVGQFPLHHREYEALLNATAPVESIRTGPAFVLSQLQPYPHVVPISPTNAALLEPLMSAWLPDVPHRSPFMAAVIDGRAVAVCASVRITADAHQAGVETHPDHRRQGHALAVVSAWASAVRQLGAMPLYSTTWDNPASRAVAAHLGGAFIGADYQVR